MQRSISDSAAPRLMFASEAEGQLWLDEMSKRLERRMPDQAQRRDFLRTVQYEATRAGLDPQLVLGLIQVESGFNKYAVSVSGARGYMQVMPFWVKTIGTAEHNLFHMRLNLATAAPFCAIISTSSTATSIARWAATTVRWARRAIPTSCSRPGAVAGVTSRRPFCSRTVPRAPTSTKSLHRELFHTILRQRT